MKKLISLLVFLLIPFISFSQSECEPYLPVDVGTQWEMTNYNAKGKQQGKIQYELLSKETNGNEIVFTVQTTTFDKKGKELYTNNFTAKCVDGEFEFDMAMKMDGASMGPYQNMEVEVDASRYDIPDMDTAAGTDLADGTLQVTAGGGPIGLNMIVEVTNRKVEARETITTPAGDFDCLVLTQEVRTKLLVNVRGKSKEWYSPNIGVVRTESYNKKGKMMGYSEITSITR
ncbi:hypothetical protein POV27_18650 [Aureisphaera galaxeae]|uniref:TapB family protein n=1 Tax=Aureisphaera galaxeae TaxID=1538023 RepID=UPI00234FC415|nr:hypothetical protein [Aureisphaera galaxeae]MDC8006079.1 hypothetical protein [Aureisphaera galaxeae]